MYPRKMSPQYNLKSPKRKVMMNWKFMGKGGEYLIIVIKVLFFVRV